jgi:hypothetical protein
MKTSCPSCGALFSLDVLIAHEGAREAVMAAMQLPAPLGWHMIRYVALFRPAERQLSMDRLANLLNELLPMIRDAKIERNKRIWSAPVDYWKMALEEMLGARRATLNLPLKSHGYLLEIIAGYSNREEAKREAQIEAHRAGHTAVGGVAHTPSPPAPLPPAGEGSKTRSKMPESVKAALKPSNN